MEALEGKPLYELEEEYASFADEWGMERKGSVLDAYLEVLGKPRKRDLFERAMENRERVLKRMGWYGRSLSQLGEESFEDRSHSRARESESVRSRLWNTLPGTNHPVGETASRWKASLSLVYRRLHPLLPSYTVVAHGGGGTWGYHYRREKGRLTNRERARLQGFPDSFLFVGSSSEVRSQIGEAVPPLFLLSVFSEGSPRN